MVKDVWTFNKIKNDDIQAFEALFRNHYGPLCHYVFSFVYDTDVAEDIVQELFYTLWAKREHLFIFQSLKAYLYGAARNNSLAHIRHIQVKRDSVSELADKQLEAFYSTPQIDLEYEELKKQLDKTLLSMPERRRQIFCMNRFEGKKYTEIAAELNLSVKTIEAEISKALSVFKKESHLLLDFPNQTKEKNETNRYK